MGLEVLFRPNAMKSMQKAFAQCQKGTLKQAEVLTRELSGGRIARTVTMPIENGHRSFIQIVDKNGKEICHKTKDVTHQTIFSEDLKSLFPNIKKFTFRKSDIVDCYKNGAPYRRGIKGLKTSLAGDGHLLGKLTPLDSFGSATQNIDYVKKNVAPENVEKALREIQDVSIMNSKNWDKISIL